MRKAYLAFIIIYALISLVIITVVYSSLNKPISGSPELPYYTVYIRYPAKQAGAAGLSAFLVLLLVYFILDYFILHKWKEWRKALAVLLSLILIIAGVETAMRIASAKYPPLHRPNPVYLWELSPNLKGEFKTLDSPINTNSHGFRMGNVSKKKPEGQFRVMVLGDSSAFGYGVNGNETFSSYLEDFLKTKNTKKDIKVINAAVSGYSTFQAMKFMEERGWEFSPDVLIVAFNDDPQAEWIRDSQRVPPKHILPVFKVLYKSMIYLQLRKIMLNRQIAKYPDLIKQPPPVSGVGQNRVSREELKKNLANIIGEAKKRGVKVIVVSMPQQIFEDKMLSRYRKAMKEAADEGGAKFLDLFHQWEEQKTDGLFFDVMHPTPEGHKKIGESLSELIEVKK